MQHLEGGEIKSLRKWKKKKLKNVKKTKMNRNREKIPEKVMEP